MPSTLITIICAINIVILLLMLIICIYIHKSRKKLQFMLQENKKTINIKFNKLMKHTWSTHYIFAKPYLKDILIPSAGVEWRISADLLSWILNYIESKRPKVIVELGSGITTIIFAKLAKVYDIKIYSIESDKKYVETTFNALIQNKLSEFVNLIHAPIVQHNETNKWFDVQKIPRLKDIDLLLVDGPPGNTGKHARFPALNFFWSNLAKNSIIILDDGDRSEEQEISKIWTSVYSNLVAISTNMDHNPIILEKH